MFRLLFSCISLTSFILYISDIKILKNINHNFIYQTKEIVKTCVTVTDDYIPYFNQEIVKKKIDNYFYDEYSHYYSYEYQLSFNDQLIANTITISFILKLNLFTSYKNTINHYVEIKGGLNFD